MTERIIIPNNQGEKLAGKLHGTSHGKLIILCHGLATTKDEPIIKFLAEQLERAGYACFRFDFSGNGESEGEFIEATYHKEVDDLIAVLDWFEAQRGVREFCLIGHSMGGGVVKVVAGKDSRVAATISLAGVTNGDTVKNRHMDWWKIIGRDGIAYLFDERKGDKFPIDRRYFDSASTVGILESAKKAHTPVLLIHGATDVTSPKKESEDYLAALPDALGTLTIIEDCDHWFGMCPWIHKGSDRSRDVLDIVLPWIAENF